MDQETDFSICSSGGERISSLWAEQTATETKGTMDGMVEQVQGVQMLFLHSYSTSSSSSVVGMYFESRSTESRSTVGGGERSGRTKKKGKTSFWKPRKKFI
ncbi:hypothetical protein CK203_054287 [Vitis vinifera]|uniref:Uncharacterized protein n=1 Tax=Vitis vinifera TaxID=29760 RepID=A0A438GYZ0_VITVI|nr:hypothetical protein CK203_054287 [Vitis vinifera]